jgi:cytochrome c biogenesis protein CcmG, thiol:disulfide interchange protein DsbE
MVRQWFWVGAIVLGIGLGAGALVWFGPQVKAVQVGAPAPDFRVYDLGSGDSISLRAHYKGTVTLINIWATYCVPCKVEMPSMQRLYDSLGSKGFKIAAVSIDPDGPQVVRKFTTDLRLNFDILQDQSGGIQQLYQTTGVPESFLVDKNGLIVKRVIGAQDWNGPVNRALVERLLAAAPGS